MARKNYTLLTEFILLGLADTLELQVIFFCLFSVIYTLTVVGNVGMILLIRTDSRLHTPMYFFLANLSFVDVCYSSTITPKTLVDFFFYQRRKPSPLLAAFCRCTSLSFLPQLNASFSG